MKNKSVEMLFEEVVADLKSFTIDEIADAVEHNAELVARIIPAQQTRTLIKQQCRRLMKSSKDAFGFSRFMSVRVRAEDGTEQREYKQPQLFDLSEYEQAIADYGNLAVHYGQTAVELRNRCKVQFGKQIPLPFNEHGFLLD